jgi:hypothetical protein
MEKIFNNIINKVVNLFMSNEPSYKLKFDAELDKLYPGIHLIGLKDLGVRNTPDCGLMPYWSWSDYVDANSNKDNYIILQEYFFNNYMAQRMKDTSNYPDYSQKDRIMFINSFEKSAESCRNSLINGKNNLQELVNISMQTVSNLSGEFIVMQK